MNFFQYYFIFRSRQLQVSVRSSEAILRPSKRRKRENGSETPPPAFQVQSKSMISMIQHLQAKHLQAKRKRTLLKSRELKSRKTLLRQKSRVIKLFLSKKVPPRYQSKKKPNDLPQKIPLRQQSRLRRAKKKVWLCVKQRMYRRVAIDHIPKLLKRLQSKRSLQRRPLFMGLN